MLRIPIFAFFIAALQIFASASVGRAQQTTVGAGMQNSGNSFFEGVGVGMNARGPNWFFTNGGGGVVPPFGGFDPNAGATLGFGFGGPGFSGSVNIGASQGSSRGISSTAGSITIPNGGFGSIADVTQRPFVTGVVPIVGGFVDRSVPQFGLAGGAPAASGTLLDERMARLQEGDTPTRPALARSTTSNSAAPAAPPVGDPHQQTLAAAKLSSAGQTAGGSIAEIRRKQAAEDEKLTHEIQALMAQGRAAQAAGKNGVARVYFEQVVRRANGTIKNEAEAAIRTLK